jgi:EAL and modified HD-GYP domain-containing signal transduction protein
MEIFVARQPIFDRKEKVFAYELLFRQGVQNYYESMNGDQATIDVIANSFLTIGMETLTRGKRAFINFTTNLIKDQTAYLLPTDLVVIEILENIEPDQDVILACQKLKKAGYLLALDDFVFKEKFKPLIDLVDIIKIDFIITRGNERANIVKTLSSHNIMFLAEKVETREEFDQALQAGYSLFQGYFFSKPFVVIGKNIPSFKLNSLRLLQEIHNVDSNFDKMEVIIKGDVSLSYNLLKFINSAFFGLKMKIISIKQALVLLGLSEVRKWASLVALQTVGKDKPSELIISALVRAAFGEALARKTKLRQEASNIFFMGMFSLMDAFLDRPLAEVLEELPLTQEIKQALLGENNRFSPIYNLVLAYEKAEWIHIMECVQQLDLDESEISGLYLQALTMANQLAI